MLLYIKMDTAERYVRVVSGSVCMFLLVMGAALFPGTPIVSFAASRSHEVLEFGAVPTRDAANELLCYFWFGRAYGIPFSSQAQQHLADVRMVFDVGKALSLLSLCIFVVSLRRAKRLEVLETFSRCSALLVVAVLAVAAVAWFDFGGLFVWFHRAIFPQGGWLLFPDDLLVRYFPTRFFSSCALGLGVSVELLAASMFLSSRYIFRRVSSRG